MTALLALKVATCLSSIAMFGLYVGAVATSSINDWTDPRGKRRRLRRHQRMSEWILYAAVLTAVLLVVTIWKLGGRSISPWLYIPWGIAAVSVSAIRFYFNGLRYPAGHAMVGIIVSMVSAFLFMIGVFVSMFPGISN